MGKMNKDMVFYYSLALNLCRIFGSYKTMKNVAKQKILEI